MKSFFLTLVETVVDGFAGVGRAETRHEKRLHRMLVFVVIFFLIGLIVVDHFYRTEDAAGRFCEKNQSTYESVGDCMIRHEKIAGALRTIGELDQSSVKACSHEHGDDLYSVWNCALLKDGTRVSERYRMPGEGD